jgi:hypothetical protein
MEHSGSARAALKRGVIGSPQQWEFAGMARSRWNFGGLWRGPVLGLTQKEHSDTDAHTQREYQRKIVQRMYEQASHVHLSFESWAQRTQHSHRNTSIGDEGVSNPMPKLRADRFLMVCTQITLLCDATKRWNDNYRGMLSELRVVLSRKRARHPGLDDAGAAAVTHVYDLLAVVLGATRDAAHIATGRGVRAARLQGAKAFVTQHLARHELSAAIVAAHLGVTPRYVDMKWPGRARP